MRRNPNDIVHFARLVRGKPKVLCGVKSPNVWTTVPTSEFLVDCNNCKKELRGKGKKAS
jgi:hypothetical protein